MYEGLFGSGRRRDRSRADRPVIGHDSEIRFGLPFRFGDLGLRAGMAGSIGQIGARLCLPERDAWLAAGTMIGRGQVRRGSGWTAVVRRRALGGTEDSNAQKECQQAGNCEMLSFQVSFAPDSED